MQPGSSHYQMHQRKVQGTFCDSHHLGQHTGDLNQGPLQLKHELLQFFELKSQGCLALQQTPILGGLGTGGPMVGFPLRPFFHSAAQELGLTPDCHSGIFILTSSKAVLS